MILVTGGHGRLGIALQVQLPDAMFLGRGDLNITNTERVHDCFHEQRPTVVIHLAAETSPDFPSLHYLRTNIQGTSHVAYWAMVYKARLIYTSTDYVYPGVTGDYREDDPVLPIGRYAASKLAGEYAVACVPNHLIIRGSWYDRLTHAQAPVDAFTSKLRVAEVAPILAKLALSDATGVVNVGGPRRSLYDVVREDNPDVEPVKRHQIAAPYPIPADVSLNTAKMRAILAR